MKFLLVLTITGFFSLTTNAQNDIFKNKPWEAAKQRMLQRDSLARLFSVPSIKNSPVRQNDPGVVRVPLKGTFSGENGKGDEVYAMQPDNMPCLVPGKSFRSNMPVAGPEQSDKKLLPLLKKGNGNKAGTENP